MNGLKEIGLELAKLAHSSCIEIAENKRQVTMSEGFSRYAAQTGIDPETVPKQAMREFYIAFLIIRAIIILHVMREIWTEEHVKVSYLNVCYPKIFSNYTRTKEEESVFIYICKKYYDDIMDTLHDNGWDIDRSWPELRTLLSHKSGFELDDRMNAFWSAEFKMFEPLVKLRCMDLFLEVPINQESNKRGCLSSIICGGIMIGTSILGIWQFL